MLPSRPRASSCEAGAAWCLSSASGSMGYAKAGAAPWCGTGPTAVGSESAGDGREQAGEGGAERPHGGNDGHGDEGHHQAVLHGGRPALVTLGLEVVDEHQGHELQLLDHWNSPSESFSGFRAPQTGTRLRT